jgi:hypothetical protein
MASPPSASDVAAAVMTLAANSEEVKGKAFVVSGNGLEPVS